jgi:tetratricopeptide (TPR) repeat protein
VRTSRAGQGMGVKFVHTRSEDRSRLNQFLKSHIAAGNIEEDLRTEDGQVTRPREMVQEAAPVVCSVSSSWEMIFVPREKRVSPIDVGSPFLEEHVKDSQKRSERRERILARAAAREAQPILGEKIIFEEELKHYVAISEKGTYNGLLGIAGDCDKAGSKRSFYVLARKFHPDRHMNSPQCAGPLQQLMGAITEAYRVLSNEESRANYDRKLAHSQMHTEAEENTEQCFRLATNCRRDGNVTGAIFWFRKCVNLAPEVARYHASLAASLATLSHFRRDAVEHFQRAIELDQWGPFAYLQLGELFEAMQLPWRAGPLYSKVLEMDPGHSVARQRLAVIDGKANKKAGLAMSSLFSKKH